MQTLLGQKDTEIVRASLLRVGFPLCDSIFSRAGFLTISIK